MNVCVYVCVYIRLKSDISHFLQSILGLHVFYFTECHVLSVVGSHVFRRQAGNCSFFLLKFFRKEGWTEH